MRMRSTFIDRKSPEILEALCAAPLYKKQGSVRARPAVVGEKVRTLLMVNRTETENRAEEDDWAVTNPDGETYLIPGRRFRSLYEEGSDGTFLARGYVRAIKNPFGTSIEILASWGHLQYGDQDCMIADSCDAEGNIEGEPYLIDRVAFEHTFAPV